MLTGVLNQYDQARKRHQRCYFLALQFTSNLTGTLSHTQSHSTDAHQFAMLHSPLHTVSVNSSTLLKSSLYGCRLSPCLARLLS